METSKRARRRKLDTAKTDLEPPLGMLRRTGCPPRGGIRRVCGEVPGRSRWGLPPGLFNALYCVRRAPLKRLDSCHEMIFPPPYGADFDLSYINGLGQASSNRGRSQGAVGRSGRRGGLTDQVRERRDGLGTGDPQPVTEVAE